MMVAGLWILFLLWMSPDLLHAESTLSLGVTLSPAQAVGALMGRQAKAEGSAF